MSGSADECQCLRSANGHGRVVRALDVVDPGSLLTWEV